MKKYKEFLNEAYRQKFRVGDFVKRKKDGKISQVKSIDHTLSRNLDSVLLYIVNFGDTPDWYKVKDLEKPEQHEIDALKYNL